MTGSIATGIRLHIRGKVQGVGFRPFVWQLARELGLKGDVCNTGDGVVVRLVVGPMGGLINSAEAFLLALQQRCPPLAKIETVEQRTMTWETLPADFTILSSQHSSMNTQIVPDAATCPDCLREMNDPFDRRYRYPFINCMHCGPRLTIIRAMPYDRASTVMADFPLCADCDAEYRNPADRRFHAQPVACPKCGPHVFWIQGDEYQRREAALSAALNALQRGEVIAIKGLGGMHLAVDASDDNAVLRLRQRKRRPSKPLAVMLPDSQGLPQSVREKLTSPAAPIVLLDKRHLSGLSHYIAPGLNEVGVMLPANPLQHLLMKEHARPLVMTSGNFNGRPPALTNEQALEELKDIADGWLLHNRDIVQRLDDSVMREEGEMLRRSRGFVPDELMLPPGFSDIPPLLAVGADLKNTFCFIRGERAVISQHFGDLGEEGAIPQWKKGLDILCQLYDFAPEQVVVDAHPGYSSTRLGREMELPVQEVLHHHAHAAACLAENGWPREAGKVIALTLDGIGYGESGQFWGGECLLVDYLTCEHLGGLPAVALPGGDLAARQPWRNLLAQFLAFVPEWETLPEAESIFQQPWQMLAKAIKKGVNSPLSSSAGRLFDAVAAALGLSAQAQSYEGEAACCLEAVAAGVDGVMHPVTLPFVHGTLDMVTFWRQWLSWKAFENERAWAFHDALAGGLAAMVRHHAKQRNIRTVVMSGGVLHNRLLRQRFMHYLGDDFTLMFSKRFPSGDGSIALGQAAVAAARWLTDARQSKTGRGDIS